ncbi:sensor histidine kinase [Ktedonosporobacter rubrisoli]|uniref:histidine kinase n=1 Tax=Ktedonosporobacter rubrisoli TaxID=2509675 RepID=A0A4V0YZS6_KTERU|nr:sensor histidine kinase [Ktedonosporobacter rubrisoli]QBD80751.1 sensor histidine kinase [Ktedonosporobacter rubrisoli]
MSSQARIDEIVLPVITRWLTHRAVDSALVTVLVLNYLISILGTWSPTFPGFVLSTSILGSYGALFWWLTSKSSMKPWQLVLCIGTISLLTFISGLVLAVDVGFNWLLYLVTVTLYFTHLSLRSALILSPLLYLVAGINMFILGGWHKLFPSWVSLLAGFGFVAIFALSDRLLKQEQKRSQKLFHQLEGSKQELEQAHQQLQAYANEVEELAKARERTRLARDIHDTLGHYLTIISIQLETISKLQERDQARAIVEVEEAKRVAAQCMQEVRHAVAALRPRSTASLNIPEALSQLGNEFRLVTPEIDLTLDLETTLPALSAELQLAFYRAAQEALTNVRKHAQASKVLVRLRYEDEILELVIRDNGQGSLPAPGREQSSGFGLIGLRERIELLGGEVAFGPLEAAGYRVAVQIRVPQTLKAPADLLMQESEA